MILVGFLLCLGMLIMFQVLDQLPHRPWNHYGFWAMYKRWPNGWEARFLKARAQPKPPKPADVEAKLASQAALIARRAAAREAQFEEAKLKSSFIVDPIQAQANGLKGCEWEGRKIVDAHWLWVTRLWLLRLEGERGVECVKVPEEVFDNLTFSRRYVAEAALNRPGLGIQTRAQ